MLFSSARLNKSYVMWKVFYDTLGLTTGCRSLRCRRRLSQDPTAHTLIRCPDYGTEFAESGIFTPLHPSTCSSRIVAEHERSSGPLPLTRILSVWDN